jgi:hypothetical protein
MPRLEPEETDLHRPGTARAISLYGRPSIMAPTHASRLEISRQNLVIYIARGEVEKSIPDETSTLYIGEIKSCKLLLHEFQQGLARNFGDVNGAAGINSDPGRCVEALYSTQHLAVFRADR